MASPGSTGARGRGLPPRRPGLRVVRREGSASFYLDGTIGGKRFRESLGTDDPVFAEQARAQRETELYRSSIFGVSPDVTFERAVISYIQRTNPGIGTRRTVEKLLRHFGPKTSCRSIDQAAIDRAGRAICPGAKMITVQRQVVTPAKAVLNHAARRGWTDVPRFERIKASGKRTDWFTPSEGEALITAASSVLRPLLIFLFGTGARVGEALALQWRDVDLQHARATLRATKNGDDRLLDLPPRVVAAMASLSGDRRDAVFRDRAGRPYRKTTGDTLGPYGGQIRKAFSAALRKAGILRALTPHHLRHSWATWHYAVHRDLMRLRDDGGWRTVAMAERYTKLAPPAMAAEIIKYWGAPVIATFGHATA